MKSKKNFKGTSVLTVLSVLGVIAVFAYLLINSKENYTDSYFYSMDTIVETIGENDIKTDVKNIFSEAEKIFDRHDPESETSKLNAQGSGAVSNKLSDALNRIIKLNEKYGNGADITVGALTSLWNITGDSPVIPEGAEIKSALKTVGYENIVINGNNISLKNGASLDFGCAAKGAALDYVKTMLNEKKAGKTIVSAGSSSILLYGDDSFTTSILSPESDDILGKIHTSAGFVSTSGGYHRYTEIEGKKYIHIIDTQTGMPSETDLTSVTVFCQSGIDSDFLSTLIFADGTENIDRYLNDEDIKIVAVDVDKNIYVSNGLDFELTDNTFNIGDKK